MGLANIASVFPIKDGIVQDASKLIGGFDFSKISVRDVNRQDFLHVDLAPSFGTLDRESVKKLDDEMKIMIAGLTKTLAELKDRSWDNIVKLCSQSVFLETYDKGIEVHDSLMKNSSSAFKTNGSPDDAIVREVEAWFKNKISDADVLKSTKIDIGVLGRIVAQSGATVDSFESFFAKRERHEKTILDVGILRYPDFDNPYFKIYRIQVKAWSDSSRVLFVQEDRNGIELDFNLQKYKARSSVISQLQAGARKNAIEYADNLFA